MTWIECVKNGRIRASDERRAVPERMRWADEASSALVIDYLIHGKHSNGYSFFLPLRLWGPRGIDFDHRLRSIVDQAAKVLSWEIEERTVRWVPSLLYWGQGNTEIQFVFYGGEE